MNRYNSIPLHPDNQNNINEQNIIDYLNYTSISNNVGINPNNYDYLIHPSFSTFQNFDDSDSDSDFDSLSSSSVSDFNNINNNHESDNDSEGSTNEQQSNNYFLKYVEVVKLQKNKKKICNVCKDSFCKEQEVFILPCGHFFHKDCITSWFNHKQDCPSCRTDIDIKSFFIEKIEECDSKEELSKKFKDFMKLIKNSEKIKKKLTD